MAPPKIFVIGATGFVGGDALYVISKAHPDWEITAMVRNSDKGAKVAAQYPKTRLVYGNLESLDLITEESAKADIVYTFADCDDAPHASAVVKGLQSKTTPSYLIHTSGTGILTFETSDQNAFGEALPKVYNDFSGISELTSLPDHAMHRDVDKIVLSAHHDHPQIHTAIVCPPTIYGLGRGPDNQDSIQVPLAARAILKHGEGFSINSSSNIWCSVHVHDLSNLYLLLGEAATNDDQGSPATWNDQGYYLASSTTFIWSDVLAAITSEAHNRGLVKSSAVRALPVEEINEFSPGLVPAIGANSIGDAIRAEKLLGWKQEKEGLMDTVPTVVEREARKLGLVKGHGEMVGEEVRF